MGSYRHNLYDILHVGPAEVHGPTVDIVKDQLHVVTLGNKWYNLSFSEDLMKRLP